MNVKQPNEKNEIITKIKNIIKTYLGKQPINEYAYVGDYIDDILRDLFLKKKNLDVKTVEAACNIWLLWNADYVRAHKGEKYYPVKYPHSFFLKCYDAAQTEREIAAAVAGR